MTRIKFCGLSTIEEIEHAATLGAAYVGVVVQAPKSHRNLPLPEARRLIEATPAHLDTVLVTPTDNAEDLAQAAQTCQPDIVQISGNPAPDELADLRAALPETTWKSHGLDPSEKRLETTIKHHDALVLDTLVEGYGGHGVQIDWTQASQLRERLAPYPLVLAGGLTPGNVADAIRIVDPFCVDVSSGIETEQRNDPDRMRRFAQSVQNAQVSP